MKTGIASAALWALACGLLAGKTIVVYEGFDYLEGGCLAGAATGSGWAGGWAEAGEGGSVASELIIGPGNFPLPPGYAEASGRHVDLNHATGDRRVTRRMSGTLGGGTALQEHAFSFVLDLGPGQGVDFAGIELSHSAGGPVVFIGKPPGAGPANAGVIGIDLQGQGFTGSGVAGSGQKHLRLHWSPNPAGAETLVLTVSDATTGEVLGAASRTAEFAFDQVTLVARRDLAAGGSIPAFDELRATSGEIETCELSVSSENPASQIAVTVTPSDLHGEGGHGTPFDRVYALGTSITLTAPATAAGGNFLRWRLDGSDYSTRRSITVAMSSDRALTAVYAPVLHVLSVASSGSSGPVDITVSPSDDDGMGGGTTPFTRGYSHGAQISLGAPSVPGRSFLGWQRDGSPFASTASVVVTLDGDASFTAVYHDPAAVRMTNLKVSGDGVHLGWRVSGGFSYIVEASPDPSQGFQAISGPLPVGGGEDQPLEFTEPAAAMMPRRFYRLRIVW